MAAMTGVFVEKIMIKINHFELRSRIGINLKCCFTLLHDERRKVLEKYDLFLLGIRKEQIEFRLFRKKNKLDNRQSIQINHLTS